MAYERRRLSTESDKSSTSTTHSTESNGTHSTIPTNIVHPTIPSEQKASVLTTRKTSHLTKRNSSTSSPAEQILARTKNTFVDLNPYFQCSSLPNHWRKNKSLNFIVRAKHHIHIKPNTRVTIYAGNDYNPCAKLKNNVGWFRDGQAEFNDLRFLGASGRGKKFTLSIIIESTPPQQCTYRRAIKITVDGPRKKRELKVKSDLTETQADESNMEGDSDNEVNTQDESMNTETNASLSQGSSGLLLLAAAAEQKRRDEEEEPSNRPASSNPVTIAYPSKQSDKGSPVTNCLSPSSTLSSQFTQSIDFSTTPPFNGVDRCRIPQHVFLPNANSSATTTTTTVPLMPHSTSTNLLLSFKPNQIDFFNSAQRRDQQTMVQPANTSSSTNTSNSTHVLCR